MSINPQEEAQLAARGLAHDTIRRYLVWRRSLLLVIVVPLAFSAGLSTLEESESFEHLTRLGWIVTGVDLVAGYLLPIIALTAALLWMRPRWSRRVLVGGWVVGFLLPMLTALVPLEWLLDIPKTGLATVDRAVYGGIGVAAAVIYYLALMPTILSLLPGLLRACIRIKSLLPGSILSGWFLVAGAPFYALLLLVLFIALNQAAHSPLLQGGMGLLLTAPLVYAARARLFIRPLRGDIDRRSLVWVQRGFLACVWSGAGLLVAYLFTRKIAGLYLVGFDEENAWASPWQLARFAIEYVGRSWFITAVAADLLLRATLSAWHSERRFQATVEADEHSRRMEELGVLAARFSPGER